jgi:ribosome recycling factor
LEKQQKDKVITEDDLQNGKKQIDDITKEYSEKADSIVKKKSNEIMLD